MTAAKSFLETGTEPTDKRLCIKSKIEERFLRAKSARKGGGLRSRTAKTAVSPVGMMSLGV